MAKKGLPRLSDSIRFYVEDTLRIRPRSHGIEGWRPPRRSPWGRLLVALLALAFLVGLFLWWSVFP